MIRKFRYRSGERGNSVVEFALVLPIMLLVIFGIFHFGRAIMTTNILYTAAREGARAAAIDTSMSYWQPRVNTVLTAASVHNGVSSVSYDLTTRSVRVTVTSQFAVIGGRIPRLVSPYIAFPDSIPLSASAVMKYEK